MLYIIYIYYIYIYIWMFPKMVVPTTMGFSPKNDHFGVFWGYPYFWKHPYINIYIYMHTYVHIFVLLCTLSLYPPPKKTITSKIKNHACFNMYPSLTPFVKIQKDHLHSNLHGKTSPCRRCRSFRGRTSLH